eukprot:SAG31_NODE_580_length_13940_cov_16.175349_9_plen_64_part_00
MNCIVAKTLGTSPLVSAALFDHMIFGVFLGTPYGAVPEGSYSYLQVQKILARWNRWYFVWFAL